jgi:hypothetical protein
LAFGYTATVKSVPTTSRDTSCEFCHLESVRTSGLTRARPVT